MINKLTRILRYKIKLKSHRDFVNIVALGDIHRASRNCSLDSLFKVYDWIKKNKCYVIGMGDLSEWISATDKRFDYNAFHTELLEPDAQFKQIYEEFKPFKEKIIALLDGNHDYSFYLSHYHNYIDALAHDLGTEYGTFDAVIRLEIDRENGKDGRIVDVYAHHGCTNSRTMGGKINRIEDLAQIFPDMDLYLMGHVHTLGEIPPRKYLVINQADIIVEKEAKFGFTGGFLEGYTDHKDKPYSSYVARGAYRPTSLGSLLIKVQPFRGSSVKNQDRLHMEISTLPS